MNDYEKQQSIFKQQLIFILIKYGTNIRNTRKFHIIRNTQYKTLYKTFVSINYYKNNFFFLLVIRNVKIIYVKCLKIYNMNIVNKSYITKKLFTYNKISQLRFPFIMKHFYQSLFLNRWKFCAIFLTSKNKNFTKNLLYFRGLYFTATCKPTQHCWHWNEV